MKKNIKILVSVLLVAAILISTAWYLFEYDPEFTRDVMLRQAQKLEESGHTSIAVWLYDLAYSSAKQDETVAIELAEFYKSMGNYSKAEYTLTKAIEDGGNVELYVALCRTFVEQDKLRDAVLMLDSVSDPTIRSQLDAMRPKNPTVSVPSGYYSQYLSVTIDAHGADLFLSYDQDYPSTESDASNGVIELPGGETTVYAVSVGENSLVSSLTIFNYTIGGVVEEVNFADSAFEEAAHIHLNKDPEATIYSNELWIVSEFTVPSSAISCEDLRWMPNLTKLTMEDCAFDDVAVLEQLTDLQELHITGCVISAKDLEVIASLPQLRKLVLSGCYLSTITNLSGATNLTYLDLSHNSIRNLDALSSMHQLEYLNLSHNAAVSMEAISNLTNLKTLDISYNSLVTTAPVANLVNLTYLDLSANDLMKLEGIEPLTQLTHFGASYNNLIDINILKDCTQLQHLEVSNNTLLNIDVVAGFTKLEYLDFSYNEVEKLPQFSADCPLSIINGGYNKLTSLDRLSVLQRLEFVYMDYNKNLKNIDKLANCPALKVVNVYGSTVRNVSKLTNKGITVNYTPA